MIAAKRTILLAEDTPDDADLIKAAFRAAGLDNPIHAVWRGEEVIQYLKGEGAYADREKFARPWVVLLDLAMPGVGGWEVLTWVRQQPQFRLLPVVILTGSILPDAEKKALDLGASAYEVKPQSFDELVQLIKKIAGFWLFSGGLAQTDSSASDVGWL